jgi:carbamoyl-phosphate synthase large subunit
MTVGQIHDLTDIDPWFLDNIRQIVAMEAALVAGRAAAAQPLDALGPGPLAEAKRCGFSDFQLARLVGTTELAVREHRTRLGIANVYKAVDTCAAEFEAFTPYYYSTYEPEDDAVTT